MERQQSPHTRSPQRHLRYAPAMMAWLCGSLAAAAAAQTPSVAWRDAAGVPVQIAARSWCEIGLPAEPGHDVALTLQTGPPGRPDFEAASPRAMTTSLMPSALMASSNSLGMPDDAERRLAGPLQLDAEASVVGRAPFDSLSDLKATIRGPALNTELGRSSETGAVAQAPGPAAAASRTEPAIWAIVAITICGLGIAGLSAPLLTMRLTAPRPGGEGMKWQAIATHRCSRVAHTGDIER